MATGEMRRRETMKRAGIVQAEMAMAMGMLRT
jgi:hypothetical protein